MQSPDTHDAPIVPSVDTDADRRTASQSTESTPTTGATRAPKRPFDRPPRTDHATEYTRDEAEIEPFVADLR